MKNYYLQITKTSNGNLEVNSADGVFSSFATRNDKVAFQAYCEEKANEWLTSEFGNYDGWSKEQRKEVAEKWLAAKDLSEGNYNYYFIIFINQFFKPYNIFIIYIIYFIRMKSNSHIYIFIFIN